MKKPESGTCQFCGCNDNAACDLLDGPCYWMDRKHTVCSNPRCIAKWKIKLR